MAMSKYETIIWEEKMKEQIVSLARATYKDSFSNGSVFDVIQTTRKLNLGGFMFSTPDGVDTHLIVYKSPASLNGDMKILITMESESVAQGLEALKQKMRDQLGRSLELAKDLLAVSGDIPVYYNVIGDEVNNAEAAVEDARRWTIRDALGDLWMKFHAT